MSNILKVLKIVRIIAHFMFVLSFCVLVAIITLFFQTWILDWAMDDELVKFWLTIGFSSGMFGLMNLFIVVLTTTKENKL